MHARNIYSVYTAWHRSYDWHRLSVTIWGWRVFYYYNKVYNESRLPQSMITGCTLNNGIQHYNELPNYGCSFTALPPHLQLTHNSTATSLLSSSLNLPRFMVKNRSPKASYQPHHNHSCVCLSHGTTKLYLKVHHEANN